MSRWISILAIASSVAVLGGCKHSAVAEHIGDSYRQAIARTIDDPEGSAINADEPGPLGVDGKTGEQVMGRYRGSGTKAPQLPLPMLVTGSDSLGSKR